MIRPVITDDSTDPWDSETPWGEGYDIPPTNLTKGCLHKQCPNCHGTGQSPRGPCVHMISCPCPKCTTYC